jgi:uncharacterized protein YecT (DUF1311 family)
MPSLPLPSSPALLSLGWLLAGLGLLTPIAAARAAGPPHGSVGTPSAVTTSTDMSPLRQECNVGRPHVEVRNCMVTRARASTLDVEQAELDLREALVSRVDRQPALKHTAGHYDAAAKDFARFRLHQCEYFASLASGQGPQREARLACTHELNLKRKQQLQEMRTSLP